MKRLVKAVRKARCKLLHMIPKLLFQNGESVIAGTVPGENVLDGRAPELIATHSQLFIRQFV